VQCARSAVKKKDSYYKAQFNRLRSRRGPKKAICAVVASMLAAIYRMLTDGIEHHDLGGDYFDRRSTDIKAKRLVVQLTKLGFQVELQPITGSLRRDEEGCFFLGLGGSIARDSGSRPDAPCLDSYVSL
jgi:hypothetical protein